MTECRSALQFSSVFRRQVSADFKGGDITSDGGALLLREADRRLGLSNALAKIISDPRDPEKIEHTVLQMLRQRIFGIALGYEDINDHQTLRNDTSLKVLTESDQTLASPPTLCRFENWVNRASLWRMAEVLVEQFIASHEQPPSELILDFDATEDEVHGRQEGRFFHGYYDCYCFLPLYVFCGDKLLAAYLRPSKIDAALHAWAILGLLVKRLRRQWPKVRIIMRADSGFARWRMLRWCDRHEVDYIIGLARNERLEAALAPLMKQAQAQFEQSGEKQRLFTRLRYAADTWDRQRDIIAKAEHSDKGDNPRFVITSLQGAPQALYDKLYCARGEMENRIKEQQLQLFADRTSCHRFAANQFRVLLAAAAYVLLEYIRARALKDTELAHAQCGTIRLRLLKIGARVVRSVRRIVFHLSAAFPYYSILQTAAQRLAPA